MTTATRPYRPTLGHSLAARIQKPRPRRKRPASRRSARLNAEAKHVIADVKVAYAEQQIAQSPVGREVLRLTDERTKARFQEQLAGLAVVTARQDADRCRKHHARVCGQARYGEYQSAYNALHDAESELRVWQKRHAGFVHARELVDAELRLLAEAARA